MKVNIQLGAMCDDLSVQLAPLQLPKEEVQKMDDSKNALTLLHLRGILTDAEWERVAKRLAQKVFALIEKHHKGAKASKPEVRTH